MSAGQEVAELAENYMRQKISIGTRAGLDAARRRGVRLGRPRTTNDEIVRVIHIMRGEGCSLREIANFLNTSGVPTARTGKQWYASTVRSILAQGEK